MQRSGRAIATDERSVCSGGSGSQQHAGPAEDLAKGKDTVFTVRVMKFMMKLHPEWHDMGLAYDCGSSLYTTERLLLLPAALDIKSDSGVPSADATDADMDISNSTEYSDAEFARGDRFEVDITWPNAREASHKVIMTPVSCIVPPLAGI